VRYRCFDINEILIALFNEIKNNPTDLLAKLKTYEDQRTEEDYYRIRSEYNREKCVAKFLYLNKTGFRGLYSTTKKGVFNVA
jgi:DNA adenine methylase